MATYGFIYRQPSNVLPSMFLGRRGCSQSGPKSKRAKATTYDRDIVCPPKSYLAQGGRYAIPRRETRADLASKGLIGKLRLVSEMEEDEIMAEIRSVFAEAMGNDPDFPFVLLQRCGPGSNTLTHLLYQFLFLGQPRRLYV